MGEEAEEQRIKNEAAKKALEMTGAWRRVGGGCA
jgi:hypothetical protein